MYFFKLKLNAATIGSPYLWYFTDDDHSMSLGSTPCGDYWNKTVTVNITEFDATALTISLVVDAEMGNLYEVLDGASWPHVTSETATVKVTHLTLAVATKNNVFANKTIKKN